MSPTFKSRALICAMALGLVTAFAGGLSGTLAWYAYSTRATIAWSGTSVSETEMLQIGLVVDTSAGSDFAKSDKEATFAASAAELGMTKESGGEHINYYWSPQGVGLKADAVKEYLECRGCATDTLKPVSSRSYGGTGEIDMLYQSPMAGRNDLIVNVADPEFYCKLDICIRIFAGDEVQGGESIWLTDVTAEAGDEYHKDEIYQALRLYVDDGDETQFVLNPSAPDGMEDEDKFTTVGGLLDLNKDGYYDWKFAEGKEVLYGDYKVLDHGEQVYSNSGTPVDEDGDAVEPATITAAQAANIDDINGTGFMEREDYVEGTTTTFMGRHYAGIDGYYQSYRGIQFAKANYLTMDDIRPDDDSAHLTNGVPIATTDDTGVATTSMWVYLEGWDHSVIDSNISNKFNLGLTLQIDRL